MSAKDYIRATYGAVNYVKSLNGVTFMVDTRLELTGEDWDRALKRAQDEGFNLEVKEPDFLGVWEMYTLYPMHDEAA
jgi:hypothetical protein